MKDIRKRLMEIEKNVSRDAWIVATYRDGKQKRIKLLDAISLFLRSETPPPITAVEFIGDVTTQGILPILLEMHVEEANSYWNDNRTFRTP